MGTSTLCKWDIKSSVVEYILSFKGHWFSLNYRNSSPRNPWTNLSWSLGRSDAPPRVNTGLTQIICHCLWFDGRRSNNRTLLIACRLKHNPEERKGLLCWGQWVWLNGDCSTHSLSTGGSTGKNRAPEEPPFLPPPLAQCSFLPLLLQGFLQLIPSVSNSLWSCNLPIAFSRMPGKRVEVTEPCI